MLLGLGAVVRQSGSMKKFAESAKKNCGKVLYVKKKVLPLHQISMVDVAQLVRATDCGSVGRRFEPGLPPSPKPRAPVFF